MSACPAANISADASKSLGSQPAGSSRIVASTAAENQVRQYSNRSSGVTPSAPNR
jgi:hypothetical protein